nr:hypothetical protein [Tanacetum cinerariifolium]
MTSFGYRSNPRYAIKECSSCGTLYTRDCGCSKGNVEYKILVPNPPKNYAWCTRCGYLVDGPNCQGCALLRQELEENLVTHSLDFQNTSEPSNASTNIVNAPREPYDAHIGYNCPSKVPVISNLEPCNNQTIDELPQTLPIFHLTFHSEAESPFTLDSTPDPLDGIFCKRCTFTPTEPVDSLNMGDEHLNTIPATESDEFINDDQSLSVEDVPEKIYSNPLCDEEINPMEIDQHSFNVESDLIESMPNHDSSVIISSKIDSLFDEFAGELTLLKSFPLVIDETDCHPEEEIRFAKRLLYDDSSPRPPEKIVFDNSVTPSIFKRHLAEGSIGVTS